MMIESGARTVVLDVRCLQDIDYARRGVGRHALALLRGAPRERCGIRLVGLVDPALSPLIEEARGLFDATCANSYAAASSGSPDRPPVCFVALSPMTHEPLFAARLWEDARLLRAAVVYDFIPHRLPGHYLSDPAARLRYAALQRFLAGYDLFAPISRSAGDDLRVLLGVSESALTVTGAPLHSVFERVPNAAARQAHRHILVVGGGDPRKNPEVVIRAHARLAALQEGRGVPLVVGGSYGEADARNFRAMANEAGGRPELVEVPGHVPDADLLSMYAQAFAIVCPSRDEGFSLPVVEGMAAGVPCLVSDIPAHRELVEDPGQRFAPDDAGALTIALARALDDAEWRQAALTRQAAVWPRFRASEVAARFWNAILGRLDATRAISGVANVIGRRRRPRVALLSPLPPDRSGVADYTAATCAELGRLVELHVFTETERPRALPGAASIRPLTALPHLMPGFDRVISVVGNSHFHLRIFEQLRRYGGACIAHDARMLGFYRGLLGLDRTLAVASHELGRPVLEPEVTDWLADEGKLEALFLGEIAESGSPTIVHSAIAAGMFEERYGVAAVHLPFSIYRPWNAEQLAPLARADARSRLGLPVEGIVIATFGFVHGTKAPEECVWALEVLRGWGLPAYLHFVGGTDHMPDGGAGLRELIAGLGLVDRVHFAEGYVSEQVYRDYLVGADLAIQLRTYGLGSLSGALLDCVAAGLPTVANARLAEATGVPAGYTRTISDSLSPLLLAEALAELWASRAGPAAAERRETERREFSEQRGFAVYARGLCRALELDVVSKRAPAAA